MVVNERGKGRFPGARYGAGYPEGRGNADTRGLFLARFVTMNGPAFIPGRFTRGAKKLRRLYCYEREKD
jgi:hypothetical protein